MRRCQDSSPLKISEKDLMHDYGRYLRSLVPKDAVPISQGMGIPFIWGEYHYMCMSVVPVYKEYEKILFMSWFFRIHRIPQDLLRIIYRSFLSHVGIFIPGRKFGITMRLFRSRSEIMNHEH